MYVIRLKVTPEKDLTRRRSSRGCKGYLWRDYRNEFTTDGSLGGTGDIKVDIWEGGS